MKIKAKIRLLTVAYGHRGQHRKYLCWQSCIEEEAFMDMCCQSLSKINI